MLFSMRGPRSLVVFVLAATGALTPRVLSAEPKATPVDGARSVDTSATDPRSRSVDTSATDPRSRSVDTSAPDPRSRSVDIHAEHLDLDLETRSATMTGG